MTFRPPDPAVTRAVTSTSNPILLTGASGWLGRAILDALEGALGAGLTDRVTAFASTNRTIELRSGTRVAARPLTDLPVVAPDGAALLHLAFLTPDRMDALGVDRYVSANRAITTTVLDAMAAHPPEAVFHASSGAAADDGGSDRPRAVYGRLKLADEAALAAAGAGARVLTGRLWALSGAYLPDPDRYALGSMIARALRGDAVQVSAPHPVVRSYAAAHDVASLVVAELLAPSEVAVTELDLTDHVVELRQLATLVRRLLAAPGHDEPGQGAEDRYTGDGAAYRALAARHGIELATLEQQVIETADWLRG